MMKFSIETERLHLRPWCIEDATALYKYASDPKVSELALWPTHTSVDMSRQVIKKFFMPNPYCLAITLKQTGEPIGCIGFVPAGEEHHSILPAEREIGYWVGRPHWNNGFTSEALEALIMFCRDSLKLSSLLITTDNRNTASQRVAIKNGFGLLEEYDYNGILSRAYRLTLSLEE